MDVVLVTWDGGGNLPPFLGLGRELRRRGHRARLLGSSGLRAAAERAGLAFVPTRHAVAHDPLLRLPEDQLRARLAAVLFDDGFGADLRAAVARARPDLLVIDSHLVGAQAATEALGLPYALLAHTPLSWLGPAWERVFWPPTLAARARAGLPPVASSQALWARARRVLVATTPLLECALPDPTAVPGVRYVGPIFESDAAVAATPAPTAGAPDPATPLVLTSFSTTYMDQAPLLGRVIAALGTLPVRGLVTAGPAVEPAELPVVANVTVARWVPHAVVLPEAALVVTHAGHSTVARALAHGVPLLSLPLGRDQGFIAQRVRDLGAGRVLPPEAAPGELAAAIAAMLQDGTYREGARHVAAAIRAAGPGAANAAAELEGLVAQP